jgi:hypothetical protein
MIKILVPLVWLCAITFSPALAQQVNNPAMQAGYKDPGTSTLLSVVVPGGGQLYSGETGKGLALLGVGLGGLTVGVAMTSSSVGVSCEGFSCEDDTNYVPMALGYVAFFGSWIYGIIDADDSARRMNVKRGLAGLIPEGVTPVLGPTGRGGTELGVSVRF